MQLVMGLICGRISRKDDARAATATKRSISQAESDARDNYFARAVECIIVGGRTDESV